MKLRNLFVGVLALGCLALILFFALRGEEGEPLGTVPADSLPEQPLVEKTPVPEATPPEKSTAHLPTEQIGANEAEVPSLSGFSNRDPMKAGVAQLEAVTRQSGKYTHLLKLKGIEPEILFVANHLLALPEEEGAAEDLRKWAEEQEGVAVESITSSAMLISWEGHSPERFVAMRDRLQDLFGDRFILETDGIMKAMVVPNDPLFSQQLHHTAISSREGWEFGSSAADVIVAVLDTGIDLDHEDLSDRIWINAGEISGNGVDDDLNGKVDDINGWDFLDNDAHPDDTDGHGTHMAGLISSSGNNGTGAVGVAWNATILPVRFLDGKDSGSNSDLLRALGYLSQVDFHILNASFGNYSYSESLYRAFKVLTDKGVLVVAAAGNYAINTDVLPSYPMGYNLDGIISVGASRENAGKSAFSNFGKRTVDIFAPGNLLMSSYPDNQYVRGSGTSQAAALVSGAAALLKQQHPGLTNLGLKERMMERSLFVPGLKLYCQTGSTLNLQLFVDPEAPQIPVISRQPVSTGVDIGQSIVLSLEVSSPFAYDVQWHNSEGPVAYATDARLKIDFAEQRHTSTYWAVVRNAFGEVKSDEVSVQIKSLPPEITWHTPSASILPGFPLPLRVEATGSGELSYQWYRGNSAIPGANEAVFNIARVTENDAGIYRVEVSNAYGQDSSGDIPVVLQVADSYDWYPLSWYDRFEIGSLNSPESSAFVTFDYLSHTLVKGPPDKVIYSGPYVVGDLLYFILQDPVSKAYELSGTRDYESWHNITSLGAVPHWQSVVAFDNGLLLADHSTYYFVEIPSGNIISYPAPVGRHKEFPYKFKDGADLASDGYYSGEGEGESVYIEPAVYHSVDGINWTKVFDGTAKRMYWDEKSGLYIAYDWTVWHSGYATSQDGVHWTELDIPRGGYMYTPGYLHHNSYRYNLTTGEYSFFGYVVGGHKPGEGVLLEKGNSLFFQPEPDGTIYKVHGKWFPGSDGQFYSFHGELYSIDRGLYHWPVQGDPYLVRKEGISTDYYLGKLNGGPVFRVPEGFLVMGPDQSFETIEDPDILSPEIFVRKSGDTFLFDFGPGETWSSVDLVNWVHEVDFPGTSIYRNGDHLIGFLVQESGTPEIWKKDFASWQWSKHPSPGFLFPFQVVVFTGGFAVRHGQNVYISNDGLQWTITFDQAGNLIEKDGQLFAESGQQVYKAIDGGMSWIPIDIHPRRFTETDHLVVRIGNGSPLIASRGEFGMRPGPVLLVEEDASADSANTQRQVLVYATDPHDVESMEVFLDGEKTAVLEGGTRSFLVDIPEPAVLRLRVDIIYNDGWRVESKTVPILSGISLTPLSSGWLTEAQQFALGVSTHATENAFYAIDRQFGNVYKTENGVNWELLRSGFGGAQHLFIEPRKDLLAVSTSNPSSSILGAYLDMETDIWSDIPNPKQDVFTTFVMFPWNEALYVLFADGDIYSIDTTGGISWVRNIDIPDHLLEGNYNLPMQVRNRGNLLLVKMRDEYFLTDDLVSFNRFTIPDGWRLSSGLNLLRPEDNARARIENVSGELASLGFLEAPKLDYILEAYPGWFVGESDGYKWVGNEYGQFFPLADTNLPIGNIWIKNGVLMTISAKGNYYSFSGFEFEVDELHVENVYPDSNGVAQCELTVVNNGLLIPTSDTKILCDLTLHAVGESGLFWEMDSILVDFSRSIPTQKTVLRFGVQMPDGLPLGDYYLVLDFDADDQFSETDETNNSAQSNPFVLDPNLRLIASNTSGGYIESSTWSASVRLGAEVALQAKSADNYVFLEWSGDVESARSDITLSMRGNTRLQAHFVPAWLVGHFPGIQWKGVPGWYGASERIAVYPFREDVVYGDDFGWLIHAGAEDVAVWHPELGWLWHFPDVGYYYAFETGEWISSQ